MDSLAWSDVSAHFPSSALGDPSPLPEYSVDASRRLALASYALSLLARRREPRLWPGVLGQLLWAGIVAPYRLMQILRMHNWNAEPFEHALGALRGM
eukprot:11989546-Alexandrium_andersonii.AAC.1